MKKRYLLVIFLVVILIGLIVINYPRKTVVVLSDDLVVDLGSDVSKNSFIKEVKNGQVVSSDEKVDTQHIGSLQLAIKVLNSRKKEEDYTFEVKVVDREKPVIVANDTLSTLVGKEIDLTKDVVVNDNSSEKLEVMVKGDYDFDVPGEYNLEYVTKDSSLNETSFPFLLVVSKDENNYSFKTDKGYEVKVIDGVAYVDNHLIVNKSYSVPKDYGNGLTTETKNAFEAMKADAMAIGLNLYISSGYRSYDTQDSIYRSYVRSDGQEKADTYSARPGHSEHQTGLAFDLNTINDDFTYTPEGKWVHDNCYRYGLILRYPLGKESITGYMHESWHLRYIGDVDLATVLYNNGDWLTLEEYYGLDSKYQE